MKNGVRQGELSPLLFSVYMDNMLNKVSSQKIGYRLGLHMSNVIGYTDDMVVSLFAGGLQRLVNTVVTEVKVLDLSINSEKICMHDVLKIKVNMK